MNIDFSKYQALGNDYIVIEPGKNGFSIDERSIQKICNRHLGIGSDGILYGPEWEDGVPSLKIFNPDGSEAEKSGNGLRIFAQHLFINGHIKKREFSIKTKSGIVKAKIENEDASIISIDMGKASFKPESISLNSNEEWVDKVIETKFGEFNFTCLSVGNPHAVFYPEVWNEDLIYEVGPIIENHQLFKNRTNVQMARVLGKNKIEIRIWERGAGFTQASGSSSCAAAYVSHYLGKVSKELEVEMPGGTIYIRIDDNNGINMKGEVRHVFDGVFNQKDGA